MTAAPDVYLIGASTRALAQQVQRAGLRPGCFDIYCDQDLASCRPFLHHTQFHDGQPALTPAEFKAIVGQTPWCYTGPLENAPEWLADAAQGSTLWGNSASTTSGVRDVFGLSEALARQSFEIRLPEIRRASAVPEKPKGWLYKPLSGSGGWTIQGARQYLSRAQGRMGDETAGYYQARIQGPAFGATLASDGVEAVVLGLCRSLHGAPGRPFAYAGSMGPVCSHAVLSILPELTRLARWLCRTYKLQGLWNMDLVADQRNRRWYLLEVNPRPSASMEVLELASGQSLFVIHQMIFEGRHEWLGLAKRLAGAIVAGRVQVEKRVVYAETTWRGGRGEALAIDQNLWSTDRWADVPEPGTVVRRGEPIATRIRPLSVLK